jgi:hypothetical protein
MEAVSCTDCRLRVTPNTLPKRPYQQAIRGLTWLAIPSVSAAPCIDGRFCSVDSCSANNGLDTSRQYRSTYFGFLIHLGKSNALIFEDGIPACQSVSIYGPLSPESRFIPYRSLRGPVPVRFDPVASNIFSLTNYTSGIALSYVTFVLP